MRPADGVEELAQKLNIGYDEFGFLMESHPKLRPVETNTGGVFICRRLSWSQRYSRVGGAGFGGGFQSSVDLRQ